LRSQECWCAINWATPAGTSFFRSFTLVLGFQLSGQQRPKRQPRHWPFRFLYEISPLCMAQHQLFHSGFCFASLIIIVMSCFPFVDIVCAISSFRPKRLQTRSFVLGRDFAVGHSPSSVVPDDVGSLPDLPNCVRNAFPIHWMKQNLLHLPPTTPAWSQNGQGAAHIQHPGLGLDRLQVESFWW